jgi:hypothetical protein
MDVIFDIDSTIADPSHRLKFITDTAYFVSMDGSLSLPKPDWDTFLSPEQIMKDTPIEPMWELMLSLIQSNNRILLITGRKESCRKATMDWIKVHSTGRFSPIFSDLWFSLWPQKKFALYMREENDRRPSPEAKQAALMRAIDDGFRPVMAFDDRKADAEMWRRNGLICGHIAEGAY